MRIDQCFLNQPHTNLPVGGARIRSKIFAAASYTLIASIMCSNISVAQKNVFELSSLSQTTGFTINGIVAGDTAGTTVSVIPDINGDGKPELVLDAHEASPEGRAQAGQVYVIFGATFFPSSFELTDLNGANGFTINGAAAGNRIAGPITTAGDINGDGKNDMIFTAADAQKAYVILGASSFNATFELSNLNGSNGFTINPIASGTDTGRLNTAGARDINGDGKDDLILGGLYASSSGQAYVIYGNSTFPSTFELSTLNGSIGFVINGVAAGDKAGANVAGVGDVNGDGRYDFLIGAPSASPNGQGQAGQSYVVFGQHSFSSPFELSSLNGNNGFTINGAVAGDQSGYAVASVDDVNGDGKHDIMISAPTASPSGRTSAGQTYVIYGNSTFPATFELSNLNGSNGFTVNGINAGDRAGFPMTSGDINNDGRSDLMLAAPGVNAGQVYIIYGKSTFSSKFELSNLTALSGLTINGVASGDQLGNMFGTGDINGDGKNDLAIGARFASPNGKANAGQAYVVYVKALLEQQSILELSGISSFTGRVYNGVNAGDQAGISFASGDVNHDGLKDLIFGAYHASPGALQSGQVYVVYGQRGTSSGPIELSSLNPLTTGFVINGIGTDYTRIGSAVSVGDFDADGIGDIVIGGSGRLCCSVPAPAYLIYGKNFTVPVDLSTLNATTGVTFAGIPGEGALAVATGDINNDGIPDVIFGSAIVSPEGRTGAGQTCVIYGKQGGLGVASIDRASISPTIGFCINGPTNSEYVGSPVASGDINGDGVADVVMGAFDVSKVYVVYGKQGGQSSPFELSALNTTTGLILKGVNAGDRFGYGLTCGDFNGDGIDDIIASAELANSSNGQVYVVYGVKGGFSQTTIELSSLTTTSGFLINGTDTAGLAGYSLSSNDFNDDGIDDVLIGVIDASPGGRSQAGKVYGVYGKKGTPTSLVFNLSDIDATTGFVLNGINGIGGVNTQGDRTGTSVAAGDMNGDNVTDIFVGSGAASPGVRGLAGTVSVVYGNATVANILTTTTSSTSTPFTTTSSPSSSATVNHSTLLTTTSSAPSSGSSSLNPATIGGIVAGIMAAIALTIGGIIYKRTHDKIKRSQSKDPSLRRPLPEIPIRVLKSAWNGETDSVDSQDDTYEKIMPNAEELIRSSHEYAENYFSAGSVKVSLFYDSYTHYLVDKLYELRRVIAGKEEPEGGMISKVAGVIGATSSFVPDAAAGIAVSFVASALKSFDQHKQKERVNKVLEIALLPEDRARHLAHHTASALAKSYASQISRLKSGSISKLAHIAVARAFEYLGSAENPWTEIDPQHLIEGARKGRSGGGISSWTNTKLEGDNIDGWTAEGLLGRSGVYHEGVTYQPRGVKWQVEKYGAAYLDSTQSPENYLSGECEAISLPPIWQRHLPHIEELWKLIPPKPVGGLQNQGADLLANQDVLESRLDALSEEVNKKLPQLNAIEAKFLALEDRVNQLENEGDYIRVKLRILDYKENLRMIWKTGRQAEEAEIYQSIGNEYCKIGKNKDALAVYNEALVRFVGVYGKDNQRVTTVRRDIERVTKALGQVVGGPSVIEVRRAQICYDNDLLNFHTGIAMFNAADRLQDPHRKEAVDLLFRLGEDNHFAKAILEAADEHGIEATLNTLIGGGNNFKTTEVSSSAKRSGASPRGPFYDKVFNKMGALSAFGGAMMKIVETKEAIFYILTEIIPWLDKDRQASENSSFIETQGPWIAAHLAGGLVFATAFSSKAGVPVIAPIFSTAAYTLKYAYHAAKLQLLGEYEGVGFGLVKVVADALWGGLIALPIALLTGNPLGIVYGALQGALIGGLSCYGHSSPSYDESTLLANTAVVGGLSYAYLQGMISLSASSYSNVMLSLTKVSNIILATAFLHNTVKSLSNVFYDLFSPEENPIMQEAPLYHEVG